MKNPDGTVNTGMITDHNITKGSPSALMKAFEDNQAVVLLAGNRFSAFPLRFREDCRYFVLGWYAITHAWCYPEGNVLDAATSFRVPGQGTKVELNLILDISA